MLKDKKIIIIPSVIVLLVVGWLLLIFWPSTKTIKQLKQRTNVLVQKDKQSISNLQVKSIKIETDSLTQRLEAGMRRLFNEDQLLDLGRVIDNIGKEYGLNLITITPDYTVLSTLKEGREQITEFPLTITFGGTFVQFTKFLDNIPEFPIVFQVESLKFEKQSKTSSKLTAEMRSKIVMRKEVTDNKPEVQLAKTNRT